MRKFENIRFEFISAGAEPVDSNGAVVVRDDEMVLEVELPGDRPYVIRGKAREAFFEGANEGLPGDASVHAKWTRLDHIWIGTWLEGGIDYVFMFQLPNTPSA